MHRFCLKWLLPPWGQGQDHLKEATAAPSGGGRQEEAPLAFLLDRRGGHALGLCLDFRGRPWVASVSGAGSLACSLGPVYYAWRFHVGTGLWDEPRNSIQLCPSAGSPGGWRQAGTRDRGGSLPAQCPPSRWWTWCLFPAQPPPSGRLRRATCCAG